nr:superoxide dismutase 1 copper chaperone [Quercus suber]
MGRRRGRCDAMCVSRQDGSVDGVVSEVGEVQEAEDVLGQRIETLLAMDALTGSKGDAFGNSDLRQRCLVFSPRTRRYAVTLAPNNLDGFRSRFFVSSCPAGISSVSADIPSQLISIVGSAAPSAIVSAIQSTGRDAILRGSGKAESAAVCILETHSTSVADHVRGLIRMVQVAPAVTVLDVTLRGVTPGTYNVSVRETGDISRGAASTGAVWDAVDAMREKRSARGLWGTLEVQQSGLGSVFLDRPIQIWEMIGRSVVVSKQTEAFETDDPDTLVGVIARSAGVWSNDKTVCSCSGKTVWEERKEQRGKGML